MGEKERIDTIGMEIEEGGQECEEEDTRELQKLLTGHGRPGRYPPPNIEEELRRLSNKNGSIEEKAHDASRVDIGPGDHDQGEGQEAGGFSLPVAFDEDDEDGEEEEGEYLGPFVEFEPGGDGNAQDKGEGEEGGVSPVDAEEEVGQGHYEGLEQGQGCEAADGMNEIKDYLAEPFSIRVYPWFIFHCESERISPGNGEVLNDELSSLYMPECIRFNGLRDPQGIDENHERQGKENPLEYQSKFRDHKSATKCISYCLFPCQPEPL